MNSINRRINAARANNLYAAMHFCCFLSSSVISSLVENNAVFGNEKWKKDAENIVNQLDDLYQEIAFEFLEHTGGK